MFVFFASVVSCNSLVRQLLLIAFACNKRLGLLDIFIDITLYFSWNVYLYLVSFTAMHLLVKCYCLLY